MQAMVLDRPSSDPSTRALRLAELPEPHAGPGQVRVRVHACGVCHTELDEIDGRLVPPHLPRILGHQIVGEIDEVGPTPVKAEVRVSPRRSRASSHRADMPGLGARVGIGWIGGACGECEYCRSGRENLCPAFVAMGCDVDGGYARWVVVHAAFVHRIPVQLSDTDAAPLLCAGAIGLRALTLAGLADGEPLGLTGYGASGQLILAMAAIRYPRSRVFVFARDDAQRALARDRGAAWTGDTAEAAPTPLAAIIDTTPAWTPVLRALEQLAPGGRLVINAIRKEAGDKAVLRDLDYGRHLWREKTVQSIANVTRADIRGCLTLAAQHGLRLGVATFPLERANEAIMALRRGAGPAGRVLQIGP